MQRFAKHGVFLNAENRENFNLFVEGRGLKAGSVRGYEMVLSILDQFVGGKAFKDVDEDDMRRFMRTRKIKPSTRSLYVTLYKKFFQWIHGLRKFTYPLCVEWMQRSPMSQHLPVVNASGLLDENEIKSLIDHSSCTRDRALWSVLFEGGLRISEALDMKVNDVVFDEYGSYSLVDGKTGQRRVRFVNASPYLREWLSVHPQKEDGGSWLWISNRNRKLYHTTARANLGRALKRAGIKKKVWPHLLRHSRLTANAKYMTEAELCAFAGWKPGSPQTRVYVHLSGADIDDKVLRHYGLKSGGEAKREESLKPIICPRCSEPNPATGKLCYKCSSYLRLEDAVKAEQTRVDENVDLKRQVEALARAVDDLRGFINPRPSA